MPLQFQPPQQRRGGLLLRSILLLPCRSPRAPSQSPHLSPFYCHRAIRLQLGELRETGRRGHWGANAGAPLAATLLPAHANEGQPPITVLAWRQRRGVKRHGFRGGGARGARGALRRKRRRRHYRRHLAAQASTALPLPARALQCLQGARGGMHKVALATAAHAHHEARGLAIHEQAHAGLAAAAAQPELANADVEGGAADGGVQLVHGNDVKGAGESGLGEVQPRGKGGGGGAHGARNSKAHVTDRTSHIAGKARKGGPHGG